MIILSECNEDNNTTEIEAIQKQESIEEEKSKKYFQQKIENEMKIRISKKHWWRIKLTPKNKEQRWMAAESSDEVVE